VPSWRSCCRGCASLTHCCSRYVWLLLCRWCNSHCTQQASLKLLLKAETGRLDTWVLFYCHVV
jgi:hypothetical protein